MRVMIALLKVELLRAKFRHLEGQCFYTLYRGAAKNTTHTSNLPEKSEYYVRIKGALIYFFFFVRYNVEIKWVRPR